MFQFCSLYSGSSGNSLFVQTDNTKILIDAGESAKKITDALSSCDVRIEDIDAIVVTHEHIDHVKSIGTLSKKYQIPVYANAKTWDAMPTQAEKIADCHKQFFLPEEVFSIGDITLRPFSTPHDAANSCGFSLEHGTKKISIATDLGHIPNTLPALLEGSDFLFLEANYEPEVLKCSRYPYSVKQRIGGSYGHLSNQAAGKIIAYLLTAGVNNIMLGHLSKENNFPELAYKTVMNEILNSPASGKQFSLQVANRHTCSKSISLE